jgi:hypothetical protein
MVGARKVLILKVLLGNRSRIIHRKRHGHFLVPAILGARDKYREHQQPEEKAQEQAPKEGKYHHFIYLLIEKIAMAARLLQTVKVILIDK